jgi:hypothetical protein
LQVIFNTKFKIRVFKKSVMLENTLLFHQLLYLVDVIISISPYLKNNKNKINLKACWYCHAVGYNDEKKWEL